MRKLVVDAERLREMKQSMAEVLASGCRDDEQEAYLRGQIQIYELIENVGVPLTPAQERAGDEEEWCVESDGGMTLLDYFAAHASEEDIQEHTTKVWTDGNEFGEGYFIPTNTREEAKYAYAEAMLKAREATE